MMKIKRLLLGLFLFGGSAFAATATFLGLGVSPADEAIEMSLREQSTRQGTQGFFYGARQHRGGGLRGGK